MPLPDYQGGSIVNLMASLIAGLGGTPPAYPRLNDFDTDLIARHRNVVLLVVDGLGYEFLMRHGRGSRLHEHLHSRMTSVFPSTTATAITTFLTGDAPQQHALTGWHMYLRELGTVLAVLPGIPRYGGVGYSQAGIDVEALYAHTPAFDRVPIRSYAISPKRIAHSDYNLAHLGRAQLRVYATLDELFSVIKRTLREREERQYLYAYWPELDHIGHERGIESRQAKAHFAELDAAFARFLEQIRGTDTLVLVTADHGQIDTDESRAIDLEAHPELAQALRVPLCGERRAAYCYLRPNHAERFERYVHEVLGECVALHPSRELIAEGYFGSGRAHPQLAERIGDYTLVMKNNWIIQDQVAGESRYQQIGVHGGTSEQEMYVPLITVSC